MNETVSNPNIRPFEEKPQNGRKGFKHFPHDLKAAIVVFFVALPFGIAISLASGVSPMCGIVSAIVAGFVTCAVGGSYVTVSGPAAGLAPAIYMSMVELGQNNPKAGYRLLLATIFIVGLAQVVFALFKLAKIATVFPVAVGEGMLAAIGAMIITKQIPYLFGVDFKGKTFWQIFTEVPSHLHEINWKTFGVGVISLTLIVSLSKLKQPKLKSFFEKYPAAIFGVAASVALSMLVGLDTKYLIQIPEHPFQSAFTLPDFAGIFNNPVLWGVAGMAFFRLFATDGIESLATAKAIDRIDVYKRRSDPNRVLLAMGLANMTSSIVGGITIIPGGVKSTTNVRAGARTQWSNLYVAVLLLLAVVFGRNIINLLPITGLAAVVIFIGWGMVMPEKWKHMAHIGREQLVVFTVTCVTTVYTNDLLDGIITGIVAKLLYVAVVAIKASPDRRVSAFFDLFLKPVSSVEERNGAYHVYLNRSVVSFNGWPLTNALEKIPASAKEITIHIGDGVSIIDHTSCTLLNDFVEERTGSTVKIIGLEAFKPASDHEAAFRIRNVQRALDESAAIETAAA